MLGTKTRLSRLMVGALASVAMLGLVVPTPAGALDGTESTSIFAGVGSFGYTGDGGPATDAKLDEPKGIALAADGSVYFIANGGDSVRRVKNGTISTVVGETSSTSVDEPAISADVAAEDIAIGPDGLLYLSDSSSSTIWKVDAAGLLRRYAGSGTSGFSGDDGPATSAELGFPVGLDFAPDGALFFADTSNNRIRRIGTDGVITTVAGTGTAGFSGDNGPAANAQLSDPTAVTTDWNGNVFFADESNFRVRRIDTDGIITTVVGNGTEASPEPALGGTPGTNTTVDIVLDLATDNFNALHILTETTIIKLDRYSVVTTALTPEAGVADATSSDAVAGDLLSLAFAENGDTYISTWDPAGLSRQDLIYLLEAPASCHRAPIEATWDTNDTVRAAVYRLYCAYYLRFPDQGGYDYWYNEFSTKEIDLPGISDFFSASEEFDNTYGSINNEEFLDLLYGNIFQRAADPGGRAYWLNILDTEIATKGEVVLQFSESLEFRNQTGTS